MKCLKNKSPKKKILDEEKSEKEDSEEEKSEKVESEEENSEESGTSKKIFKCPSNGNCPEKQKKFTKQTLIAHLNKHLNGTIEIKLKPGYLRELNLSICPVCCLHVSASHGIHTICRRSRQEAKVETPHNSFQDSPAPTEISFEDIFTKKIPTMIHVPKKARANWAKLVKSCLVDLTTHNSLRSWTNWWLLPKAVLFPPQRGGKDRDVVSTRIESFKSSPERCWHSIDWNPNSEVASPEKKAIQRARNGRFSNALKCPKRTPL